MSNIPYGRLAIHKYPVKKDTLIQCQDIKQRISSWGDLKRNSVFKNSMACPLYKVSYKK